MEKEKHVTLKKAKKGQKRPLKWKIKANFRLILMISMSKTWLDRQRFVQYFSIHFDFSKNTLLNNTDEDQTALKTTKKKSAEMALQSVLCHETKEK